MFDLINRLRQGQHVLFVGKNGTGKTTLAEKILSAKQYVIVIDTKGELRWSGFQITSDAEKAFNDTHTILRPNGDLRKVEHVFRRALKEGGWHVYVDELYMIGIGSVQRFPPSFIEALTRGRSKKVTVYMGTQRPRFVPVFVFTEPRHIFVFNLSSRYDRVHVAKSVGDERLATKMQGHQFLYANTDQETVVRSELHLPKAA